MYASLLTKTACQHICILYSIDCIHTSMYTNLEPNMSLRQQAVLYKIFTKMHVKCPKFVKLNNNNAHLNTKIKRINTKNNKKIYISYCIIIIPQQSINEVD